MNRKGFNIDITLILKIGGIVFALMSLYTFLKILPQVLLMVVFLGAGYLIFPDKDLVLKLIRKIKLGGKK